MALQFVPKRISRLEDFMSRGVVTANYWNELFNLLITQGEHAQDALSDIINNNEYPLGPHIQNVDGSIDLHPTVLRFLNTTITTEEEGDVAVIQGLVGPTGPQGPQGNPAPGLILKGMYSDLVSLIAAHPVGQAGDTYLVGDNQVNTTYIWDMALSTWVDGGSLQGTPGPGVPNGGTTGQFLLKTSDSDYDTHWGTVTLPPEMQYLSGLDQNVKSKFDAIDLALGNVQSSITLDPSKVVVSDNLGKLASHALDSAKLAFLAGVSSDIQTQLNGKLGTSATAANSVKWSGRQCFVGSSTPSGAVDGDIWFKVV